jgi:hypothetical protein
MTSPDNSLYASIAADGLRWSLAAGQTLSVTPVGGGVPSAMLSAA